MQNLSSLIVYVVLMLLILALCAWAIKRRFIDKKGIGGGGQFVGRHVMMQFQDADRKRATEQIIVREEERRQYFAADDKDPDIDESQK
jgi:hypothetical protein